MEAKTLVPVVGLTALKTHPCNGCDHAKAIIDPHNTVWIWCPVLQCPADKECRHIVPASEDLASKLSRRFRDAPPEEVEEYLKALVASKILNALETLPGTWFASWMIKELTCLEYSQITETLNTLAGEGRVEKKEIPGDILWKISEVSILRG